MSEADRSATDSPAPPDAPAGETAPVAQPDWPETTPAAEADPLSVLTGWLDVSALSGLITAGGPVTVVLLVMSVITLTVILAKLWQFARAGLGRSSGVNAAIHHWQRGDEEQAIERARLSRGCAARIAGHAMQALAGGAPEERVREDVERVATGELAALRSYLRIIEATVQTAPLLGLFGTVLGMISSFQALEGAGAQADPAVLAGGIWVALLTTAVGLAIAIPAALALTWFQGRIEREQDLVEDAVTSVFTRRLAPPRPAAQDGPPAQQPSQLLSEDQRAEAL
jgi:biopolymer transport protein ExbB